MTRAQKHLLMLFKEIDQICKKHNIIYYMAGGTLLGAVRHKGFIPWDDDMDLLMTRSNWYKFVEVSKDELPEGRVLECPELDRDYPNMFSRYTDINSSAIHKNQVLGDGVCGYVVDILLLDPVADSGPAYEKYRKDLMLYSDLVNPSLNYSYRWRFNDDRFNRYYKRMKKEGKDKVLSELEASMFSYPEEKCGYYAMRWGGSPFLFEKDMYGSSRWGEFEGVKCRIPDRTADYLTWHYGDNWMYIPPHGEHESHDAIFSFKTDYKTIMNDYMGFIDVPKVRKSIIRRKQYFFRHMKQRLDSQDSIIEILAKSTEMHIVKKIQNFDGNIRQMLAAEKYQELSDFFNDYYEEQGNRSYIGREDYLGIYRFYHPYYCDIGDDNLYVALMVLVHTNRIAKAARFLEVREWINGEISGELQDVRKLILSIREAISDYDLGRRDEAFDKAAELFDIYPGNISLNMFMIRLYLERKMLDEARQLIEKSITIFPETGDYYKYQGDLYYLSGDKDSAYRLYDKGLQRTNNGYVILEAKEKVLGDKEQLLSGIDETGDLDKVEMLLRIVPDDIDFNIARYHILIDRTDISNAVPVIRSITDDYWRFDEDDRFRSLLSYSFEKLGENKRCSDIRTAIICAKSSGEYKIIEHNLYTLLDKTPDDGTLIKLSGDIKNCLGSREEAKALHRRAMDTDCSPYTRTELEEAVY